MTKRNFRNRFSEYNPEDYGIVFTSPSLTEYSAYDDVNIHSIVQRGMNSLPVNTMKPLYNVNLKDVGDLQTTLDCSATLKNSFEALPYEVKFKFENSPEKMYAFYSDPKNYDECVKLGLITPEKPNAFQLSLEKIANFFDSQPKPQPAGGEEVISPVKTGANNLGTSAG